MQPNQKVVASNGKTYALDKNFDYVFASVAIPASASGSVSIVIDSDADFETDSLVYFAYDTDSPASQTASSRLIPLITINIQDTGTSEFIFSQQVPVDAVCGTAGFPGKLRKPRVFASRSNVTLYYTNISAVNITLTVALRGRKLVGIY